MYLNSSGQYIKIGYSVAQCTKIGSGPIFPNLRLFEDSFFPAPLPARLVFEPQTKNDPCG